MFCCCLFVVGGRALYISYAHLVYRATHTRDTFDSHRFLSPCLQISFLTHAQILFDTFADLAQFFHVALKKIFAQFLFSALGLSKRRRLNCLSPLSGLSKS